MSPFISSKLTIPYISLKNPSKADENTLRFLSTMSSLNTDDINNKRKDSFDVRAQVSEDLKNKLSEYRDSKKGLRAMSALMGVHEKTLKRLIDCENKASYQTLLKIYRALYQTNSDTTVLRLLPPNIAEYIKNYKVKDDFNSANITVDVDKELQKNPVFCEIYLLAGTGGVSKEYIAYNYGRFGEKILNEMIELEVIVAVSKYKFILGRNQASFTPETIKSVSIHIAERFSNPDDSLGHNYQGFVAEGLSEEAYQKWLEIDQRAYLEKLEITKDPKNHGDIKAFGYTCTDTLIEKDNERFH